MELASGLVEEEKIKGHSWCVKLTYGTTSDKLVFLSFNSQKECDNWVTKCIKVWYLSLFFVYVSVIMLLAYTEWPKISENTVLDDSVIVDLTFLNFTSDVT